MSRSGYYKSCKAPFFVQEKGSKRSVRIGCPFPGHSLSLKGELVSDLIILKNLKDYREREEFQNWGGCKVLSRYLLRDHGLRVNAKKVYRLCREFGLLLPRPKKLTSASTFNHL
ncbi:MAG: transposase [Oligoflexia bacterium]|nr:transposase [Oligoflexia bacterium]